MQPPVRSYGKFCSPAQNVWNSIPRQCFPPLKVSERQERDCSCLCSPGLTLRKSDARRRRMNCGEGTATVSHLTLENARSCRRCSPQKCPASEPRPAAAVQRCKFRLPFCGFVILTASVVVAGQDGAWCSPNVPGMSQRSVEYEIAKRSLVLY